MTLSSDLARSGIGAGAAALALVLACGGPDGPSPTDDVAPRDEGTDRDVRPDVQSPVSDLAAPVETELTPSARLLPNAAGCSGSCEQVCECLAAACERVRSSRECSGQALDCRASCTESTCSAGDGRCWQPMYESGPVPDEPEPSPPGPGPDPSPVDRSSSGSSSGSSSSGSSSGAPSSGASSSGQGGPSSY